jgi:hypothetical protein
MLNKAYPIYGKPCRGRNAVSVMARHRLYRKRSRAEERLSSFILAEFVSMYSFYAAASAFRANVCSLSLLAKGLVLGARGPA